MDIERAHIGRRIRELRKWRRMDQQAVAGLAGISTSYLSRIERGERPVTKRLVLERIAAALRVSPAELTPEIDLVTDDAGTETHSAMATLGDLLGGWWVGEVPDAPGRPLPQVLDELARFHAARNSGGAQAAGDYATQVATLAPLIRDLLVAAADPQLRREALPPLLTAYHVAGSISARLRIPGMPSLAADRMWQVAAELDDPVWHAVSQWGRALFLSGTNRARQYDLAVAVADQAPADRAETRGMANLTAALAAAARGDGDLAETHLAEAAAVAERLDSDTSPWPSGIMQFGRTNTAIHRVAISVELGHGARVAEYASSVRTDTISRGRQAAFWVDYGRGMLTERRTRDEGMAALLRAEQLAPQQVRTNVWAREAVTGLLGTGVRAARGRELRFLAWRMGIAPTG
ncbi:helix-turn-helix domain-containing protein [Actinophytocola oryzae]|uniref:Helix-turn-helix protein n=1 Tax=Actinophytocola oryzae TaxID=502181 RepID=A0A4V3FTE2_9PSEU|nr:helix-turn-helix transcriptional regulator [Actinophytocola oryzae]TDV51071.1 helix-turn-helix protein [Actinophytocola oryzae]